ncbi:MAG TPA: UpxY family transcription antiterminator [Longimicrobiales bacterium]
MAETLRADGAGSRRDAVEVPQWYACYTRSRHEKQVDRLLRERGFESFLPLMPRVSQWKDRKKVVEWPLFPSYVFGRFRLEDSPRILSTPGVATLVKTNGRPAAIAEAELENVRRFVRALAGGEIEVERRPFFAEGQWVEVMEGPLAGVRGVVVEQRSRRRVLIGLQAIGQGLEVDIDTKALRPVPSP